MKILFLTPPPLDNAPPAERIFGCNYGIYEQPNIFILYPATILKRAGHEVRCLDFPVNGKTREDFEAFCRHQDFDVIFFYTVFLSRKTDLIAREMIRRRNPGTRFVYMATEPTASPEEFLDEGSIVIRGEAEVKVLAVIESIDRGGTLEGIPGISYMKEGEILHNSGDSRLEDLDSLPFPDRTLLDPAGYHNPKLSYQPFTTMIASRGCSFGCYYCVPNSWSFAGEIEYKRGHGSGKPSVRLRSPENVIMEFREIAEAGYRSVSFIDDQFVWGAGRTLEICEGIGRFGIEWSCLARADMLLDHEVVDAMGRAGCRYVDIGVESFNQEILDYVGKGCGVEASYLAVENLKRAGIEPELNILIGSCPLETRETIERTYREVLKLDVDYVLFSVCTPFPYTKFNEVAGREGWMIRQEYEAIDPIRESFISYPHLSKDELERTVRRLYRRFYFRPSYILKRLVKLKGFKDLLNKMKASLTIFRSPGRKRGRGGLSRRSL